MFLAPSALVHQQEMLMPPVTKGCYPWRLGVPLSHPLTGWDQKQPRLVTPGASFFPVDLLEGSWCKVAPIIS